MSCPSSRRVHPSTARRLARLVAILALVVGPASCSDVLVDPAPQIATVQLVLVAPGPNAATDLGTEVDDDSQQGPAATQAAIAGSADLGAAFDRADQARIQLRQGSQTAVDVTRDFAPESGEARLQVEVELEDDSESFLLELALLWEGQVLFEAESSLTLQRSETTDVELDLTPVPDRIELSTDAVTLDALGAQAQLSATVVFASGESVPSANPTWSSTNPDVVQVSETGQVTALAVGEAAAVASWGSFSSQTAVTVRQLPASMQVTPSSATLAQGSSIQFDAAVQDANQNTIPAGAADVSWSSDEPGIASVSDEGRVEAVSDGTTTIRATAGDAEGSATVTVQSAVGSVTGQVVDGLSGSAVPGATVDFGDGRVATTDAEGSFSLTLPEGVYDLTIRAEGFTEFERSEIGVTENQTTSLGTLRIFSDDLGGFFAVWAYREVVQVPDATTPDYMVFHPPEFFWDVDDEGSCFVIDEANVVVLDIDGDLWTFEDREDETTFTYRATLETDDVLIMDLQDSEFELTFIFDRTSLTIDDFEPVCSAARVPGGDDPGAGTGIPGAGVGGPASIFNPESWQR